MIVSFQNCKAGLEILNIKKYCLTTLLFVNIMRDKLLYVKLVRRFAQAWGLVPTTLL